MTRIFEIIKNDNPEYKGDIVIGSRVTGEVFLLCFGTHDPSFPILSEIRKMVRHVSEVRRWVRAGAVQFIGKKVIYHEVYC